jgi:hypothetical protein
MALPILVRPRREYLLEEGVMRSHRFVLALAAGLAMSPVHQPATAAEVHTAAYQRGGLETFNGDELIASGRHFFGTASKGLALTVEEAVRRWGEPNGYIVGEEASAAIFGGLRYGEGVLYTRNTGERRIYWQGPSLGFDLGGDAGRTMMLVYHLPAAEALFSDGLHTRFVGLNGSAYVVGGFGFTAAMYDEMIVVPIRTGVGARLGVNVGYLKFTPDPTWNPF